MSKFIKNWFFKCKTENYVRYFSCLVYILVETARDEMRTRVWRAHLSCLSHSQPVLTSSQSSLKHVGKSVTSQRKWECFNECLHSCVPRLIHISPKVSTSAFDENVNLASDDGVTKYKRSGGNLNDHKKIFSRNFWKNNVRLQKLWNYFWKFKREIKK